MRKGYRLIGLLTVMVAVSLAYADDYMDDVYYWPEGTMTKTKTQTMTATTTTTETTTKTTTTTTTQTKMDEDVETWDAEYVQVQDTVVKLVIHK